MSREPVPETVSVDVTLRVYEDRETEGVRPSSARTVGGASAVETSGALVGGVSLPPPWSDLVARACMHSSVWLVLTMCCVNAHGLAHGARLGWLSAV
jgi:hypothetical protein